MIWGVVPPELTVDSMVLLAAVLVAGGVAFSGLAARAEIPSLLVFMAAGMVMADDGLGLISFNDAALAQNLSVIALIVILFEGGLSSNVGRMRSAAIPAGLLATVGVVITTAGVALVAYFVLGLPGETSMLLGAVVASTDAAAVFAAARQAAIPDRVAATLETESGFNDPLAIVLTIGVITMSTDSVGAGELLVFGALQLFVGLAIGLIVGFVGAWTTEVLAAHADEVAPVLAVSVAAGAYGLAVLFHGSGFLAVFVAAVVLADRSPRHRRTNRVFYAGLAEVGRIGLFFLLGLLVFPSDLPAIMPEAIVISLTLVFLARPLAVAATLVPLRWPRAEIVFVAWAGLRGGVPIVLATFPLTAGVDDGTLVFNIVFFVVMVSVLVQGSTMSALARRLGLRADPRPLADPVEFSPAGTAAADFVEIVLTEHAGVVGHSLAECPMPAGSRVVLVSRAGTTIVPDGATVLTVGDHLVLGAAAGTTDAAAIERWAAGELLAPAGDDE